MAADNGWDNQVCNLTNDGAPYWDLPQTVLLSMSLTLIMLVAIVGNVMVIAVIVQHRGMRTRTNVFLCNLAITDLLTALLDMPFSLLTILNGRWTAGHTLCQFNGFAMPLFFVASIHTLMYISVHKYVSIKRPFSDVLAHRQILMLIGAVWFWAVLIGYLTIHGLNHVCYKPNTAQCGPMYPHNMRNYIHYALFTTTCYLVPFAVMAFCYGGIFRAIRAHSRRMALHSTTTKDVIFMQQRRIMITLFVVLIAFVVSWTPYIVYSIHTFFEPDKLHTNPLENPLSYWFGYLNCACNPLIYAWRSPAFREGYRLIMCRGRPAEHSSDSAFKRESDSQLLDTRFNRFRGFLKQSLRGNLHGSGSLMGSGMEGYLLGSRRSSLTSFANLLLFPKSRSLSTSSLPGNFHYSVAPLNDNNTMTKVALIGGIPVLVKNGKIVCYRNPNDNTRRKTPNPVYYPESMRQGRPTENGLDIPIIKTEMVYGENTALDAVAEPDGQQEQDYDQLRRICEASHDIEDALPKNVAKRKPSVTIEIDGASDDMIDDYITNSATPSMCNDHCRSSDNVAVSRANSDISLALPPHDIEAPMPHSNHGLKKRQPSLLQRLFSKKRPRKDQLTVGGLTKASSSESSLTKRGAGSEQEASAAVRQTMHDYDFKSLRQKFTLSRSRHACSVIDKRGPNSLLTLGLSQMTKASSDTCLGKRNKDENRKGDKRDKKSRHMRKHGHDTSSDDPFLSSDWLLEEMLQRGEGTPRRPLRCPSIEKLDDAHHSKSVSRVRCQSQKVKSHHRRGSFQRHSISDITEACTITTDDVQPGIGEAVFVTTDLRHLAEVGLWRSASDPCLTFEKIKEKAVHRAHAKNWGQKKKAVKKSHKTPEPKPHKYHDAHLSTGGIELETSSGVFCSPHISDDECEVVGDVTVETCACQKRKNVGVIGARSGMFS